MKEIENWKSCKISFESVVKISFFKKNSVFSTKVFPVNTPNNPLSLHFKNFRNIFEIQKICRGNLLIFQPYRSTQVPTFKFTHRFSFNVQGLPFSPSLFMLPCHSQSKHFQSLSLSAWVDIHTPQAQRVEKLNFLPPPAFAKLFIYQPRRLLKTNIACVYFVFHQT